MSVASARVMGLAEAVREPGFGDDVREALVGVALAVMLGGDELCECVGCTRRWARDRPPVAAVELVLEGECYGALLCGACATAPLEARLAMLERLILDLAPEGHELVRQRVAVGGMAEAGRA